MNNLLIIPCLFLVTLCPAQNFFSKLQKGLTKSMTVKSDNLAEIKIDAGMIVNTYPKSLNPDADNIFLQLNSIWPEKPGNLVYISLMQRTSFKFVELTGTVEIDGQPLANLGSGYYGKQVQEIRPYNIHIKSSRGQEIAFMVNPVEPFKINEPSTIELRDGFTVKLESTNPGNPSQVRLFLYSKPSVTQHGWSGIDYFSCIQEIKVPSIYFVDDNNDWAYTYHRYLVNGKSWLLAERYRIDIPRIDSSASGPVKIVSRFMDVKEINVEYPPVSANFARSDRPEDGVRINNQGIVVEQKDNKKKNIPGYKFFTLFGNGGAIGNIKKAAIICFNVDVSELEQTKEELAWIDYEYGVHDGQLTIDKVKHYDEITHRFPHLPVKVWDDYTNKIYGEFTSLLHQDFGIEVIPVSEVKSALSYRNLAESQKVYNYESFSTTYAGLKKYASRSLSQAFTNLIITQANLISELKVDALIFVYYDITMDFDWSLNPILRVEINGAPTGYETYETKMFLYGSALAHCRPLSKTELANPGPDILNNAIDDKTLFSSFSEAVIELKKEEEASRYYEIIRQK
ncbi:MAG: hypothetical protein NTY96_03235 [Bacteroidetes bacterium]|nr:hypothetical protein [Bacteroidota bacterium]